MKECRLLKVYSHLAATMKHDSRSRFVPTSAFPLEFLATSLSYLTSTFNATSNAELLIVRSPSTYDISGSIIHISADGWFAQLSGLKVLQNSFRLVKCLKRKPSNILWKMLDKQYAGSMKWIFWSTELSTADKEKTLCDRLVVHTMPSWI